MLACLMRKVVYHFWLIHQLNIKKNTGKHSTTSLWLAFLTSVQQGRALEHALIEINSTSTQCHA